MMHKHGKNKKFNEAETLDVLLSTIANIIDEKADMISREDELIKDLNMDSLELVTLAVDLESAYDIRIDDEVLDNLKTVNDCYAIVIQYLKESDRLED